MEGQITLKPMPSLSTCYAVSTPARRDRRLRPGRGCLRDATAHVPLQAMSTPALHACYQVPVSQLPLILRMQLPRWARCADDADERKALPRRTRICYISAYVTLQTNNELVEWRPEQTQATPDHVKVAATPGMLTTASLIEVSAQDAETLVRALVHAETPSPIRVAPASFLTADMRSMIAPGVSYPITLLDTPPARRSSPTPHRQQVTIPHSIAQLRVDALDVSAQTTACLKQAGVTTLGHVLELEEDALKALLGEEGLWEVSVALEAYGILPTLSDELPLQPVFEEFYFSPSDILYEDDEQGMLVMVYTSVFADRLTGERSGPVDTLWISKQQVEQSLPWDPHLERLDSYEVRLRVHEHTIAQGAQPLRPVSSDETEQEGQRKPRNLEGQYHLVPFKDEVFVSKEDLDERKKRRESPIKTVLRVLKRYQQCPEEQPVAYRLSSSQLQDMHYWITEDRKRQFRELPRPASTIVKHPIYVQRRQQAQDVPEIIGYRLIIGVLANTPVPAAFVVQPRRGKPTFQAPLRPIVPCRMPRYISIQAVA